MNKKKLITRITSLLFCFAFTLSFPVTCRAFDNETYSSAQTKTVYGISYTFKSLIFQQPSLISYGVCVEVNKTADAGYIGANARCYNTSGVLVDSSDWQYSSNDTDEKISFYTAHDGTGYFYSKGQVKFYNGNGYTTYTCYATPNMQPGRSSVNIEKNEKGEVYGSEFFLNQIGIQPELIKAMGENDVIGYVKATDLDSNSDFNLSEAITDRHSTSSRTIPLYAEDGLTKIGVFKINNNVTLNNK